MMYSAGRVLLCLRYGIGDVIMELPIIAALREALPNAHVTALVAFPASQLLEGSAHVDSVRRLDGWGVSHRWQREWTGAAREFSSWLDEGEFDLFLDLQHAPPVIRETVWTRGIQSLESNEAAEQAALQAGMSGVDSIKEAVRAGWGIPVAGESTPEIRTSLRDQEFAREFLYANGIPGSAPLAISPVASLKLKRWPLERLARTADELLDGSDEPALAFCGPQEDAGEELRRLMRHGSRVVAVGPDHLLRVAALLERCQMFICNDTGLMHLAGALGVPTLGIFGPTAAAVYRPPSDVVTSIGGGDIGCPYQNRHSLHPPACFPGDRCLISDRGCIERPTVQDALQASFRLTELYQPQGLPFAGGAGRRPAPDSSD